MGSVHQASFGAMAHKLQVLTPREASMFASLADAMIAPEPLYPAVRETTAVFFFDDWLARSAPQNRFAFRSLIWAGELLPLALGFRGRLRQLQPARREQFVERVSSSRNFVAQSAIKLMKTAAMLSYYGDDGVLHAAGYDPEALLERGRELRAKEGRP